jgi:hypothetical protein
MVTGLRALAGGAPRGECELCLTPGIGSMTSPDDGVHVEGTTRIYFEAIRTLFMTARDIADATTSTATVRSRVVGMRKIRGRVQRTIRKEKESWCDDWPRELIKRISS